MFGLLVTGAIDRSMLILAAAALKGEPPWQTWAFGDGRLVDLAVVGDRPGFGNSRMDRAVAT
jgi:hypothetical protein